MAKQLPASGVNFTLILGDARLPAASPAFRQEVTRALAPLASDRRVRSVETAFTAPAAVAPQLVSADGHRVLAVVSLAVDFTTARKQFGEMRKMMKMLLKGGKLPPGMGGDGGAGFPGGMQLPGAGGGPGR